MSRRGTLFDQVSQFISANVGTKIVSLLIAVILWGIVLNTRSVEVIKEIPLEVITSPDVVPSNEIPERIAFRLSGPKAFLRGILDRREDPIQVNLTGSKPSLFTYRFFSDNIRVPIGVKVLSINPSASLIKLEYLRKKDVPLRVGLRGNSPEGYRVASVQVKPDVIRIKGPESRVDAVNEVLTTPIDISNMKRSNEKEVPLDLARTGVQLDGPLPRVMIEVEPISANFRIKNVDIRVISSYKARVEEKNITVLVRATSKDMETLDRSHVFGLVNLSDKEKGRYLEPVKVTLPKNIGLVKVIPDHVHVTLY